MASHDDRSPDRLRAEQLAAMRQHTAFEPPRPPIRFTPAGLDRISGPLGPGEFWIVGGFSNIGKSTWVISTLYDLVLSGARVTLLSLEMEPERVYRYLACVIARVDKRVAEANTWYEYDDGMAMYERFHAASLALDKEPWDRLLILPDRYVSASCINTAGMDALCFESDVLIIDHLDHLDQSAARNTFVEAGRIAQMCKRVAEECDLTVVGMKQINREAVKGDRLARYMPPQLHHLQGGGLSEQNANVVLGLYRPFQPLEGDAGKQRLKAARAGAIPVEELLSPKTLGVVCLKHRLDGSRVGERCLLHVDYGHLTDKQ